MTITYATFNSGDKGSAVTLSGGDLTASSTSGTNSGCRSSIGKSSGKWYWEVSFSAGTENLSGIADSSATLTSPCGQDSHGWGYFQNGGNKFNSASLTAYGSGWTTSNIIGVALDADGGTVTFYKDNISQGSITLTGLTAPYYFMYGNGAGSGTSTATVNFGASAFNYTPPVGYNAGLYSGSASTNQAFLMFM